MYFIQENAFENVILEFFTRPQYDNWTTLPAIHEVT